MNIRNLLVYLVVALLSVAVPVVGKGIFDDLIKDIGKTAGEAMEEAMKEAEDKKKGLVALKLFWNDKKRDYYTTTTASEGKAMSDKYKKLRIEGYMLIKQADGTLPLKTYYNKKLDDYVAVATIDMENQVKQDGYALLRTEGFVFPVELPGTVPLKLYWNQDKTDFFPVANADSIRDAENNGYKFLRIECYLLQDAEKAIPAVPKGATSAVQPTNFTAAVNTTPSTPVIPAVLETVPTTPLKLFWNAGRQDNYTTTAAGEEGAKKFGYAEFRVEGYLRSRPFSGALALKTYYHAQNEDYVSVAMPETEAKVRQEGYTYVRTEGFVYATNQPGTTPLKLYWNKDRTDYQAAATKDGINDAEIWEYKFVSTEGYLLTEAKAAAPTTIPAVTDVPVNLIAKYSFDENGGNTVNDKTGRINGTLNGDAAFVAGGVSGNCIKMSRNGKGFVNFGDNLMMSKSDFTISIWVKTAQGMRDGESWIISKHRTGYENGYWLMMNGTSIKSKEDKVAFFAGSNNTVVSTTTVNDGKWHHIVAVYRVNGNFEIYVDGIPAEEVQGSAQIRDNKSPLLIGSCDYGGALTGGFNGMVDELTIYNVALTEAEIDKLYTGTTMLPTTTTVTKSSPNIIAKYNFDETDGNIVNDKVGKVNGTLNGDAAFVAGGVSGNCIKMSRNGKGFVNFGDNLMMTKSDFTISIWVKTAPGMRDGESWIISKHRTGYENGYYLMLNGTVIKSKDDKVTFFAGSNNTVVSTTTVNDGKWHHIVGVYRLNGNEEIYVDGVPVEEKQGSVQIRENNSPLLIGSCDYGSALTGGFNGMVDELTIYNVALTEAEIDKLYTGAALLPTTTTVTKSSPNIIAKYNFDETDGNIVNDKVGKVNGTLSGDAAFVAGGVSGNCIKMSRNGKGFVNFGDNLMMSKSDFTISIWVKTAPGMRDGESWIISKHRTGYENGYWLMMNGTSIKSKEDKVAFFAGSNNTVVSTTTVNDGKWHHIVAVYRVNGNFEIYVDGIPAEEVQGSAQIRDNKSPLLIGSCDYGSALTGGFNGMVDELTIFNVALTPVEIDKLYSGITVVQQPITTTTDPVNTVITTNPLVNTDTTTAPVTNVEPPKVYATDSEQAIYDMILALRQACDKKDIEKTCGYFDAPIRKKIKDFLTTYPDQMKVLSDALKDAKVTDVNDERETDGFAEIKSGSGDKTVYIQLVSHDKNWFIKSL